MITIKDINSSFRKIDCDAIQEANDIYNYFSIKIPGVEFTPLYKMGVTDGKHKFINQKGEFLWGLKSKIIDYCIMKNIEYKDETIEGTEDINYEEFLKFVDKLDLPYEAYEHQIKGTMEALINKRVVIQSFTGSGKSLNIYILIRWFMEQNKKIMLLVPRVDLVLQMQNDFIEYFYKKEEEIKKNKKNETDNIELSILKKDLNNIYKNREELNCLNIEEHISMIYAGQDKYENKFITISTRDSLSIAQGRAKEEYFEDIDIFIGDEIHKIGATTSKDITNACKNSEYKIGFTGSLSHDIIENLTIEGLIGPVKKIISLSEGIALGLATNLVINPIYLTYEKNIVNKINGYGHSKNEKGEDKKNKKMSYTEEDKYIRNLPERNKFIAKFATMFPCENLIIIYKNKDNAEGIIKEIVKLKDHEREFNIKDYRKDNDLKLFVSEGVTKVENRNDFRRILETSVGNILIATDKVITEGTNIKNVHKMLFSRVNKKNTNTIQACGRMVRLHNSKTNAEIYDIVDDARYYSKTDVCYPNYSYKHFLERLDTYISEEFEINEPVKIKLSIL